MKNGSEMTQSSSTFHAPVVKQSKIRFLQAIRQIGKIIFRKLLRVLFTEILSSIHFLLNIHVSQTKNIYYLTIYFQIQVCSHTSDIRR